MRVLVTGAAGGIGRALCAALSGREHHVIATARRVEQVATNENIEARELDVNEPDSVATLADIASEIDAVVNNAAINPPGPLEAMPSDVVAHAFDTNVLGPLRVIQALVPAWRERGTGTIVNVSSIQGRVGTPLDGAYTTTKFALEGMSEVLHFELGHFGIRVVLVEPGYVGAGMVRQPSHNGDPQYADLFTQWQAAVDSMIGPHGRPGSTVVAAAIVDAIEDPTTPFRVEVGALAEMVLATRRQMGDAEFEATMRAMLHLDW